MMAHSDVAKFREHQAVEEETARLGLSGPAIVSRHDFIEARAERGAARILQLLAQGKYAEAAAQMNLPNWGLEEAEGQAMSHFDTTNLR